MLDKNVIKLFKSLETEDNFIVSGEEIADRYVIKFIR
jgi:hypothetical protein